MKTEKPPDASFVIPAYNMEAYLAECLSGCITQSHRNIEVVVVDDGSTDATPIVAKHYESKDPRVRYFRIPNSGRGTARNVGCGAVRSNLIMVLDADDIPEKDRAKNTIALAAENPGAYLSGGCARIDAFCNQHDYMIPEPFNLRRALDEKKNGIIHSTAAYSKLLWGAFKYDEGEFQAIGLDDWHQQIRAALGGVKFISSPKIFVGYRELSTGISKTRDEARVLAMKEKFLAETQGAIYA